MLLIISNALLGLVLSAFSLFGFFTKPEPMVGVGAVWNRLIHTLLCLGVLALGLLLLTKAYYRYTSPEDIQLLNYLSKQWDIVLFSFGGISLLYSTYQRYHKEPSEISFGSKPRTLMKYGFYTGIRAALGVILLVHAISELIEYCSI